MNLMDLYKIKIKKIYKKMQTYYKNKILIENKNKIKLIYFLIYVYNKLIIIILIKCLFQISLNYSGSESLIIL